MSTIDYKVFLREGDPQVLFEVIEEIGQGSFGFVYKARNRETGELVAIKKMLFGANAKGDDFRDIMKEIQFISTLDHPNCVKHHGSYVKGQYLWMVMEFCVGSAADLLDVFKEGMSEKDIAAIIGETVEALAYLHSQNKIHRDIKAANILITGKGEVKLGDFGSASLADPANTFVGTPCWIAPEVILAMESGLYTAKMDVWSLGITCIELAERKPPLFDMNPMSTLYHIPQNDAPTLTYPAKWSPEFQSFVSQCLKKDPADRSTTQQLREHPFIRDLDRPQVLKDLVRKAKHASEKREKEAVKKIEALAKNPGIIVSEAPPAAHDAAKTDDGTAAESSKDGGEGSHRRKTSHHKPTEASESSSSKEERREARKSKDSEGKISVETSLKDEEAINPTGPTDASSPSKKLEPASPQKPLESDSLSRKLSAKVTRNVSLRDLVTQKAPVMSHSQSRDSFTARSEHSVTVSDDGAQDPETPRSVARGGDLQKGEFIFEGTIRVKKDTNSLERKVEQDKEYMKKQLKEFKAFQSQLQKRKAQLVKHLDEEEIQLRRIHEREMEVFNKSQLNELEKLSAKNKKEMEEFTKKQAKDLKLHEEELQKKRKNELSAHTSDQKKIVKEKEKDYKEKRNDVPKAEKQLLKDNQERELEMWKESHTRDFNLRLTEAECQERKKFQEKQLLELQEVQLRIFLEEYERRKLTKELLHQKKLKHMEALQAAELDRTTQIHNLERDHQEKTKEFEETQLLENHMRFEKDLKKYHSLELKNQPKHIKTITTSLKKELAETVKMQKKRHSLMQKQLEMEETSKEDKKRILLDIKADEDRAITLQAMRYEKKISEAIEHEITQLDAMQQREAQEMQAKQEKQRKEMENYHEFRRKGLEIARAEQIKRMMENHEKAIAALKVELETDLKEFSAHYQELRKTLEANHAAERATLKASI